MICLIRHLAQKECFLVRIQSKWKYLVFSIISVY